MAPMTTRTAKPKRTFRCIYCGTEHPTKTDWLCCTSTCSAKSAKKPSRHVSCWRCSGDVPTAGDGVGTCRNCGWVHPESAGWGTDPDRVPMEDL